VFGEMAVVGIDQQIGSGAQELDELFCIRWADALAQLGVAEGASQLSEQ
jgi:hypothetical protein